MKNIILSIAGAAVVTALTLAVLSASTARGALPPNVMEEAPKLPTAERRIVPVCAEKIASLAEIYDSETGDLIWQAEQVRFIGLLPIPCPPGMELQR